MLELVVTFPVDRLDSLDRTETWILLETYMIRRRPVTDEVWRSMKSQVTVTMTSPRRVCNVATTRNVASRNMHGRAKVATE